MEKFLDRPLREVLPLLQEAIVNRTHYKGVPAYKCPLDAWVYMELLHEVRPAVVVEIGTHFGGSTLFLADMLGMFGGGRVMAVDVDHSRAAESVRNHPRISMYTGDAVRMKDDVLQGLTLEERRRPLLVIEDSSHTFENTLSVLRAYSPLVTVGSYFIVEDGICHHGLEVGPDPGPYEALEAFVRENPRFEIDRSREKFVITWNPKGFLRRRGKD